jgi:hypothetical protein
MDRFFSFFIIIVIIVIKASRHTSAKKVERAGGRMQHKAFLLVVSFEKSFVSSLVSQIVCPFFPKRPRTRFVCFRALDVEPDFFFFSRSVVFVAADHTFMHIMSEDL